MLVCRVLAWRIGVSPGTPAPSALCRQVRRARPRPPAGLQSARELGNVAPPPLRRRGRERVSQGPLNGISRQGRGELGGAGAKLEVQGSVVVSAGSAIVTNRHGATNDRALIVAVRRCLRSSIATESSESSRIGVRPVRFKSSPSHSFPLNDSGQKPGSLGLPDFGLMCGPVRPSYELRVASLRAPAGSSPPARFGAGFASLFVPRMRCASLAVALPPAQVLPLGSAAGFTSIV